MNPNQPPVDYLNQISYTPPTRTFLQKIRPVHYAIAGVVALIIIFILSTVVSNIAAGPTNRVKHLAARLATTETIAADANENIKNTQLLSTNSSLKIYLTNTNRDIATPLKNLGISLKKMDKSITKEEAATDVVGRLEDARLNAIFDRTYAREMSYQLETTLTLMQQIHASTKSKSLKTFLETAYDNLLPIQESFASFSATNG